MQAICYDECGMEVAVYVPDGEGSEWVKMHYPEYRFRHFEQTPSPKAVQAWLNALMED